VQPNDTLPDFMDTLSELYPAMKLGAPVVEFLRAHYWTKLRQITEANSLLRATMPGMLIAPDKIVVYIGRTHLAIEYFGRLWSPNRSPIVLLSCLRTVVRRKVLSMPSLI
jgi:hypothetical protein